MYNSSFKFKIWNQKRVCHLALLRKDQYHEFMLSIIQIKTSSNSKSCPRYGKSYQLEPEF